MTNEEKILILEDLMEVEERTLKPETLLSDIDEWDSVSLLSFIAMVDEEFEKVITGKEVKSCNTVSDLMRFME